MGQFTQCGADGNEKKIVAGFISMPQQSVWNNHPEEMDKNLSII